MKKPSKKYLRNQLDKYASLVVRKRGKCERCGKTTNLQACHIFSRKYNNTRWDVDDNILCLDASCHFWGHANPILFTEFVKSYLGDIRYEALKERHNQITKFTIEDLQIKLTILKEMAGEK